MLKIAGAVVLIVLCSQAQAQQRSQLNCQGALGDVGAALSGVRLYSAYNSLGDGYVKFAGTVSAGGITGRIVYEGYTQTGAFSGEITSPQGVLRIGVLDNTGGQMIIYSGTASLGPPQVIGRFVCRWQ